MSLIKFKMMYFEIKWGNYVLVCYHAIPFQNDHERHRHTGIKPFLIKSIRIRLAYCMLLSAWVPSGFMYFLLAITTYHKQPICKCHHPSKTLKNFPMVQVKSIFRLKFFNLCRFSISFVS